MNENNNESLHEATAVSGMYENWFLDYASYVILERAVPAIEDGLKPVQRRILHAMKEMDDGRYNKVANIIGQTMQYHPHGDASIYEAIVNMGQKDLLIDKQGNWGNIYTGDGAAASRYIEARLSKFALDVVFNADTTPWQLSYDGRKKEPITLPVKFPLLLAQGVEGIAVGLSTKIMPHNFCELITASIDVLKGKEINLYPDFQTGGLVDVTYYNEGARGSKLRIRSRIEELDKKTLVIKDVPYGVNTTGLMESIVKANDSGKIKIKKVVDNTAKDVEIQVHLAPNVSPDITIDALYAFTDCEISVSPNTCVIIEEKPHFVSVNDMLKLSTQKTVELLRQELEIKKGELLERILYSSLEKIFIENRIYRKIEECETWDAVLDTIDKALDKYKKQFYRAITTDDIVRLTEIKIKRISKYDGFKADELMKRLQDELEETEDNLANLTRYAINYFKELLKKYCKGGERKTEIRQFNTIAATAVAAANQKLYVNRKDGFIGVSLKKDENVELIGECSDIDDIIIFRRDGVCKVVKVQDKVFVGKDIIHAAVFKKNDERQVYNLIYVDGKDGIAYVKRFQVTAVTRDREYDLTKGNPGSKVVYFTANPNAEAEVVTINLTAASKAKIKAFDYNFAEIEIKGRSAQGNILTKHPIRKVSLKSEGTSTMGGLAIWYDESIGRLNREGRGRKLGNFEGEENILVIYKDGQYELTNYELTNRYEPNELMLLEKFDPATVVSAIHYDGTQNNFFVKRFRIETTSVDKKFSFISESKGSRLVVVSTDPQPQIEVTFKKSAKDKEETQFYDLDMLTEVRGWKALGNKLSNYKVLRVKMLASKPEKDIEKIIVHATPEMKEENAGVKVNQLGIF
ncbi:DNA gyrase/topoisomerase IV subunit A [Rhodocytophaga rosea]|uniref:DNA gyrase/topoisomerase IV subunit A n=1 Tax=Rhodocytophaga rosea TaxID=2704465 RepID=A0A6C0GSI7_9BACT|nr:DNA gyrase/topoisomerase IV subunit A [Rhodocytophaga rosea]QHT70966.1 DNA gyrase/topoisomerase IV subunit A [Rhodocytophaga rosea]